MTRLLLLLLLPLLALSDCSRKEAKDSPEFLRDSDLIQLMSHLPISPNNDAFLHVILYQSCDDTFLLLEIHQSSLSSQDDSARKISYLGHDVFIYDQLGLPENQKGFYFEQDSQMWQFGIVKTPMFDRFFLMDEITIQ